MLILPSCIQSNSKGRNYETIYSVDIFCPAFDTFKYVFSSAVPVLGLRVTALTRQG